MNRRHPLMKCLNCFAFVPNEKNPDQGLCHFEPPKPLAVPARVVAAGAPSFQVAAALPTTAAESFCLKFLPDPETGEIFKREEDQKKNSKRINEEVEQLVKK